MAQPSLLGRLPRFHRGAFGLFLVTAIATALLADQPVGRDLVLVPQRVLSGEAVWAPLTAPFVYPEGAVAMLFGTLLTQWFIAGSLEAFWGTRKYVTLVLGSAIAGYAMSVLLALVVPAVATTMVGGATPIDLAAITAFGAINGRRPLSMLGLPLSARAFAALFVGLIVLGPLVRGAPWPVMVPWLTAIAVTLLVTTRPWRRLRSSGKVGGRQSRRRGHLKVVRPDRELLN